MTNLPNLKNKSVALVGPAVPVEDQSAEVDACDFIIRCNYRWNGAEATTGYGDRIDAAFYSVAGSKSVKEFPTVFEDLPWVILKESAFDFGHPGTIKTKNPFPHTNQMPILLNWVRALEPAEVHIFGADFYTSGYGNVTQGTYLPNPNPREYWQNIQIHDQARQHSWMKAFQDQTGLIKGDSRMVELLSFSTEEVVARLNEAWREYSG